MPGGIKLTDLHTMFAGGQTADEASLVPFCVNCRRDGHVESECSEPRRCYICHQSSHVAYQCVENPVPGSIAYNADARCSICGEKGHIDLYCRSREGPLHNKPLSRAVAETTYPKPLVLRTAEGNGPKEEVLQGARADVMAVLRRWKAAVVSNKMRDVELFQTALPALRDPSVSAADLTLLRQALATLRSAVVGSLTLDGSASHRRTGSSGLTGTRSGAQHDGQVTGDVLHDMRVSGLNLNVVVGDRVETFKRAPASRKFGGARPKTSSLATPKMLLAEMKSRIEHPPVSAEGEKPSGKKLLPSPPTAVVPSDSPQSSPRLYQLRHVLDEAQRTWRQPGRSVRCAGADVCSVHSNMAGPPKPRSGDGSSRVDVSSSVFTSSQPEYMESKVAVAGKILLEWEGTKPTGQPVMTTSPQLAVPSSWLESAEAPGMDPAGRGINSWPRYYLSQKASTQEHDCPTSRTVLWRKRFENCKAAKNDDLRHFLACREAHRCKVSATEDKYGEIVRHAEQEAALLTPSLPSSSAQPLLSRRPSSARRPTSFWTATCREIAAREAELVLVQRFRSALNDYVARQRLVGEAAKEFDLILTAVRSLFDDHPTAVLDEMEFEKMVRKCIPNGEPQTAEGTQLVAFVVQLCRDVHSSNEAAK